VVLAGGRGTRFWPRSRTKTPKQLLSLAGDKTMIEQTVARLHPLIPANRVWTITNLVQASRVRQQLPRAARRNVLAEPAGRNTAAAIGLAAIHVRHASGGDALLAILPSDQYITDEVRYRKIVAAALEAARTPGNMVVLGIPPTRPETGFGYIELGSRSGEFRGCIAHTVRRFIEKPPLERAREYCASGNYQWNAGMFFWRISTYMKNLQRYLPETHAALEVLAPAIGTRRYARVLRRIYPRLQNISVDYAILEPAVSANLAAADAGTARILAFPADVGWSDLGSWAAVYELLAKEKDANVFYGPAHAIDAAGNLIYSPGKFSAAIGVRDLVVVDTPDALLVCPRERAQEVSSFVKWLETTRRKDLL
jgi:mannose-1-phosphate guanylyltransferase